MIKFKIKFFFACMAFILMSCFLSAAETDGLQKNFTILETKRIHELNPHLTDYASDTQILNGLFEGLFTMNPVTLEPQLAIAKDFKISRDKKRWTITLRDDVFFSNGEKITAEEVKSSWIRMISNQSAPFASLFDIVRGVKDFRQGRGTVEDVGIYATGEDKLSIYLDTPANYLTRILCHTAFSVTNISPDVYSGPFVLERFDENQYVLKKNQLYWDKENVALEQITFVQSDNSDENAHYYNMGKVDWICGSATQAKILKQDSIQINALFGTGFFYFRITKNAANENSFGRLWNYPEFRNAVLEAFPWDDIHKNYLIPAKTFVYPLNGYPDVQGFEYSDQVEASMKMREARKKYGVPQETIIPLVFQVFEGDLTGERLAAIQNALEPLGIEVKIREIPSYLYYSKVKDTDADILFSSWIGDFADPLSFLELFRGGSTMNNSGWHNEEYDSLLEKAAVVNVRERYDILAKAENILLDDGVVFPLYRTVTSNYVDLNEVGGWAVNAFDFHPLKYIFKKAEKIKIPNIVMK